MSILNKLAAPALLVAFAAVLPAQSYQLPGQAPPQTAPKAAKPSSERPVSGIVTDADGKAVAGAVVQLKNVRTLQIRSFITREKGDYYFAGLSKDVDYEVKAADSNGHSSAPKTLSAFDTRAEPVLNLQLK